MRGFTMYIQLNGQILSYEKEGEGSPIIFLHGNGETHAIWDRMIAEMSMDHTVYAIDSRGQGDRKSTRLNSSHSDRSRMPSSA